ncbi:39S ribosomal protein L2, mitochondrial [Harmonia axyridis]|uniref:39S ribosomal protein L2, mitochondrial n=1 Tax=Harmonia axyridis TaxID=115357 RepID=UPI001E279B51|nr:39S ribosomal protein L2, mitochondrial [Harmonia axyridis]
MNTLRIFSKIILESPPIPVVLTSVRFKYVEKPPNGVNYRRKIHYPEKYTIKPLDVTNLAGRHPVTGKLVIKGLGGGIKHKYHWIDWKRIGPKEGPPLEERVIKIIEDGCRTANVALVASGQKLRYILATENMKPGDIIKTSGHIPRIPVRPNEGDAYPLGALPLGTQIHCIEKYPGLGGFLVHAAGTYATILRKADKRVIIMMPSKKEFSLPEICMCTVGRIGNIEHSSIPIGSPNRLRELGYRPRSGLWQRKTGRHGRKIKPPPPVKLIQADDKDEEIIQLTFKGKFVKTLCAQFHY